MYLYYTIIPNLSISDIATVEYPRHLSDTICCQPGTAEQAHAVDAATRPRDPSFFEGQNRLERDPDLWVAAHLMGRPLGGNYQYLLK